MPSWRLRKLLGSSPATVLTPRIVPSSAGLASTGRRRRYQSKGGRATVARRAAGGPDHAVQRPGAQEWAGGHHQRPAPGLVVAEEAPGPPAPAALHRAL